MLPPPKTGDGSLSSLSRHKKQRTSPYPAVRPVRFRSYSQNFGLGKTPFAVPLPKNTIPHPPVLNLSCILAYICPCVKKYRAVPCPGHRTALLSYCAICFISILYRRRPYLLSFANLRFCIFRFCFSPTNITKHDYQKLNCKNFKPQPTYDRFHKLFMIPVIV